MESTPEFIAGCQGVGDSWKEDTVAAFISRLDKAGIKRYDTGTGYPASKLGESERLLGKFKRAGHIVDTKILFKPHALRKDNMEASIKRSLRTLGVSKIDTIFVHGPDKNTPLAEQAANFDGIYRAGLFNNLGLCNYSPEALSEWLAIASEKKYIKPSVYKGQYNVLFRHYEITLFPLLREHRIPFIVTSPLAGGFLTGKVTFAKAPRELDGTKFEESEGDMVGALFRAWYDKASFHAAVKKLGALQGEFQISSLAKVTIRWLLFHSALNEIDAVAIGPSNLEQLEEYLAAREEGPLPDKLASAVGELYEHVKTDAAPIVEVGWWSG